jgi:predicted dehydrogenase/nucleoside-diphosphate-sugar epimerase
MGRAHFCRIRAFMTQAVENADTPPRAPVLVTGASGYLAGRLCAQLPSSGWRVTGLSRQSQGERVGYEQLHRLLPGCRALVHCAAVTEWFGRGERISQVNADWPVELYRQCLECGVEVMIFISSLAAGGLPGPGQCLTESQSPGRPLSDYARAKRSAERRLQALQGDTRLVILRTGLIYDPRRWPIQGPRTRLETPDQRLPLVHADNVARAVELSISTPTARGLFHVVDPEQPYTRQLCDRLGVEANFTGRFRRLALPALRTIRALVKRDPAPLRRTRHATALARRSGTCTARRLYSQLGYTPATTLAGQLRQIGADRNAAPADAPAMTAAMIGAGRWARVLATQLRSTGRIRWRALCDPNVPARSLPRCLRHLPLYRNLDELLDGHHFDAAVICSPNRLHATQVSKLAPHVRALYVEKPLASSARELEQIEATAETFGTFVLAGHGLGGTSAANQIRDLLTQAGPVLSARLVRTLSADYPDDDWRSDPQQCPGGVIAQLGIHLLDLATRLLGPVGIGPVCPRFHPRTNQIWSASIVARAGQTPLGMYCAFAQRDRLELIFQTERGRIRATDGLISWTFDDVTQTSPARWDDAASSLAEKLHEAWWDLRGGLDAHSQAVAEAFNDALMRSASTRRRATA